MNVNIQLAGIPIRIEYCCQETRHFCRDYLTEETELFTIAVSEEEISFERNRSAKEYIECGRNVREWSDAYLETLAIYRKIAEKMPFFNTILFHGSCVAVDGKGYLFTAKSGTGKSTHTRLWRELFGERAVMINDDKPLIRMEKGSATVYGTPWDGKHHLSTNAAVPLESLCILGRAENNSIRQVSADEAYPAILQQVYRPMNAGAMSATLTLVDTLIASVNLWRLECNMDSAAAALSYHAMKI